MIRQLRKRHLQVWRSLMFLLPAGIISAWLAIPEVKTNGLLQPKSAQALPVIIRSVSKGHYTVNIRSNTERTATQLEWINRAALENPSALIYKINGPGNELIGRIDVKGSFYFPLKQDTAAASFMLYDIIHKQVIDTINF